MSGLQAGCGSEVPLTQEIAVPVCAGSRGKTVTLARCNAASPRHSARHGASTQQHLLGPGYACRPYHCRPYEIGTIVG